MTTYTQDLAAPLPLVLQAQTGTTATLYLFDMGTRPLAEYDSAWEYLLPDGLGSVRQLVDAGGNVKLTESYEPYGSVLSSQGSATSAFGFTGEQFESYIELLYLRARYYDGRTGRFTQRDLWPGRPQRPISLNRSYVYANQNPINMTDCSGLWPTKSGIGDIREVLDILVNEGDLAGVDYQYSCNCGWIDWPHALSGMQRRTSLASRIFTRLKASVDWTAYPLWTGKRGILAESYGGWQGIIVGLASDVAIMPESNLSNRSQLPWIAAGIFMEHSERAEEAQLSTVTSYFSEEDLPSDLIGLYVATKLEDGTPYRGVVEEVVRLCQVVSKQESQSIYENEYQGGGFSFKNGWRRWDARLIPITRSCTSCNGSRQWPSQFSNLSGSAVHSARNNGVWWWDDYPMDWLDEILQKTNVDGVYALERRNSP